MIWYDVVFYDKRMRADDSVALFDLIRHSSSCDDAERVEEWARNFERKMNSTYIQEDVPSDCYLVDGYDGNIIEIFAVVC